MKRIVTVMTGFFILIMFSGVLAQTTVRQTLDVPKASGSIVLDGNMDESDWGSAAKIDLVTAQGYNIFANKYGRESLTEPEYDELYARLMWTKDTLYVFVHIDEFVNDSTNLFWQKDIQADHWSSDQLFVSISNRLGTNLAGNYDGNVYAAPDGPYHFLILGDKVTLNGDDTTYIPEEYRSCFEDSLKMFLGMSVARYATKIDTLTGLWNVEMAIYNPNVNADAKLGFNLGGSMASRFSTERDGDAYGYWTWQPNIPNDPFGDPFGNGDPGFYNLKDSDYWAVLNFTPGTDDIIRKSIGVPMVNAGDITIDGKVDDAAWANATKISLIGPDGYNIFANKYGRESLTEPEYDELYAKAMWSLDTLYLFIHIDEFVNDSTNLFWQKDIQADHWSSDQLFVSLSDRLGTNLAGNYDGNVYAAPDGPYHFLILGDKVTLNGDDTTYVPEEYRKCFSGSDSMFIKKASDFARYATFIDTLTGVWDVEMAIYNPHITAQSEIGFNIGGSSASRFSTERDGDAYGYWTWQPNIPNDPYGDPFGNGDPGFYNLKDSDYWAAMTFSTGTVNVNDNNGTVKPEKFALHQNYPNPFNPTTTIRFDVSDSKPVSLKIFNSLGQMVANLVDGKSFSPGTYSVTWNASGMASGVYFYQLKTNDVFQTLKMILLK